MGQGTHLRSHAIHRPEILSSTDLCIEAGKANAARDLATLAVTVMRGALYGRGAANSTGSRDRLLDALQLHRPTDAAGCSFVRTGGPLPTCRSTRVPVFWKGGSTLPATSLGFANRITMILVSVRREAPFTSAADVAPYVATG